MLKQRHFLSLSDYSAIDLKLLLDTADDMKKHPKRFRKALKGRILAMIFERASTHTRVSLEAGMYHLGGTTQFLSSRDIQLGHSEPIPDAASILSRIVDGIMARTHAHRTLLDLAQHSTVPVINGLTDQEHPCQALGDLLTIREKFGRLEDLKLTYLGDGNNMAHSLLQATARSGMDCTIISPNDERYQCNPAILAQAREDHERQGTRLLVTDDLNAVQGSHVIYTDTWVSMGREDERVERIEAFRGFAVTRQIMDLVGPNAVFMHCLPAHRGYEVEAEVIDGPQSVVYDQAENAMWAQMSVMYHLMGESA